MPDGSKTYLFIVNNAPYGDERPYNAFRLAHNLVKREGTQVRVFLTADGYYNIERMVKALDTRGKVAT